MTETPPRTVKKVKPVTAESSLMSVVRRETISPGFLRVTLRGVGERFGREFRPMGFDQWFRLFLPVAAGEPPLLPGGGLEGWYARWLALHEGRRPVIRNYTVRAARRVDRSWELDVDFVLHRDPVTGDVEGVAATWAAASRPGDLVGFLDQGTICSTAPVDGTFVVVTDETGVPAAEGIARSLPAGARATLILEVPHDGDRRPLPSVANVEVRWCVRAAGARPGAAALSLLGDLELTPDDYVYAVGEASFALFARTMALEAGVPDELVDFCAYWRRERGRGTSP